MEMSEIQLLLKSSFEKELLNNRRRHVVFWYDAEGEFLEDIKELELADVRIWILTENNLFATKYELETVDQDSDFLIYANMEKPTPREDWLLSILKMGSEFQTDKVTIMMREFGITDNSLRLVIKKYAQFFNNKVRYSAFKSFRIDYYTEETIDLVVLAVLSKSPFPVLDDIVRTLLKQQMDEVNSLWSNIEKYGGVETFWRLVVRYYGYALKEKSLSSLMNYFVLTYLSEQVSIVEFPDMWMKYTSNKPTNAIVFMNSWMNHRLDRPHFNELTDDLSKVLHVNASIEEWDIEKSAQADAFRVFDEKVICYLQEQLISGVNQFGAYEEMVKKRRRLHWYPEYKNDYEAIEYARRLSQFAHERDRHIPEQSSYEMFRMYENEYYQADLFYRKFYAAYDQVEKKEDLSALRTMVEDLYTNWFMQELSVKWTSSLERQQGNEWPIQGIEQQSDFYRTFVQPHVSDGERLFVIVSDALRFEVAKELMDKLNHERRASTALRTLQSVIPSYTDLGMAALLPHREIGYKEQEVYADDVRATGTMNRTKILNQSVEESLAITYQGVITKSRNELRGIMAGKKLVYIYHNEIDARGDHAATEMGVFEAVDDAMNDIRFLINQLVNAVSASTIMITADHGFIYQRDQLEKRDKIPKDPNDSLIAKRRFLLSEQELYMEGTLTYSMDYLLGHEKQLYVTVPKGSDRFQVQGAGANYVHGGAMLQEIVVPVITYKNDRSKLVENDVRKVEVQLTNPVRKITNVITYLEFFQKEKVEGKRRPNRLMAYFVGEEGQRISNENIIIADSSSGDPHDRTYREKFIFRTLLYDRKAHYYLILQDEEETAHSIYEKILFAIDIVVDDFNSGQ